ncbi:hypothetical protein O0550_23835 [Brevibacillus halotolerans]|nr:MULTISPECIES: hypothetical protein [Brevibacillus]MCR8966176.1 hypothetical protein [Brevibacillus laterosporus]MCZ0838333.1 hypothetical protein [Brevibacillus halotolerans]
MAVPALAQGNVVSSVQPNKYCKECNAVGFKYPKKDYSESDFVGTYITYSGEQYKFSHIDKQYTTDTHWYTVWVKEE